MKIEFTKMHGAGNDYVYVNCLDFDRLPFDPCLLAKTVSLRRYSIGSDGLVLICRDEKADAYMRMFNADGSEGMMCGNAVRCVARYLYDRGYCKKSDISIMTASGLKKTKINSDKSVTVDMGYALLGERSKLAICGRIWDVMRVSTGNPHAVCFCGDIDRLDLETIGPAFENAGPFGERVNAEFVKPAGGNRVKMRVWERGSGETLACGTGACASVAAAVKAGYLQFSTENEVELRGGTLRVVCTPDYRIYLTGDAVTVYDGVFEYAENQS